MPRATDEQRQAFAAALHEAMRRRAEELDPTPVRMDDWLGERIGMSGQALRNYLAAIREPKSAEIVERIEDELGAPRHHLGQHLGYGRGVSERLDALEAQVATLSAKLREALQEVDRLSRSTR